eukprot:8468452-Pyramimonas_sp.AAC.1
MRTGGGAKPSPCRAGSVSFSADRHKSQISAGVVFKGDGPTLGRLAEVWGSTPRSLPQRGGLVHSHPQRTGW